jgi:hypothetical protein
MKGTRFALAAMVLGTALGASQAKAQLSCGGTTSCNLTNTASVTIPTLVSLSMGSATTALTTPTAAQVEAGTPIDNPGPTFTVKANRAWTLNINSARAAFWDFNAVAGTAKPISDLGWSLTSGSGYAAITSGLSPVSSGAATNGGTPLPVYFRTNYSTDFTAASNAPGIYSLPIVFTLSAP